LYAFDLSPDLGEDDDFNLTRQGGVRLDLKFADGLPNTVTVIAYAEFENVIEIDRNRTLSLTWIMTVTNRAVREDFVVTSSRCV